jgi:vacuolar-type H+-ATPase catalytic subunit A/Vma1
VKQPNKALAKNKLRRKQNFNASWSTYKERLQDYIQKNDFAENHGACDECSEIAEKSIV